MKFGQEIMNRVNAKDAGTMNVLGNWLIFACFPSDFPTVPSSLEACQSPTVQLTPL